MTVETLPPEYTFGKVVGRIIHAVADTAEDVDDKPEARPAAGQVMFAPREKMRVVTAAGHEAIVTHGTETANLSATGRILDAEGRQGIWLVTGTYDVSFKLASVAGHPTTLDKVTITVTADHDDTAPLDLSSAVPYVPPVGTTVRTMLVPSGGGDGQVLGMSGGDLAWVGGGTDLTTYGQVSGLPDYPTTFPPDLTGVAPADIGAATSAQGARADSAVQPGSLATVATSGAYADLTGKPAPGYAVLIVDDINAVPQGTPSGTLVVQRGA